VLDDPLSLRDGAGGGEATALGFALDRSEPCPRHEFKIANVIRGETEMKGAGDRLPEQ
jgi:hypothetical protein